MQLYCILFAVQLLANIRIGSYVYTTPTMMNWHLRYIQQANWTRELREYLFQRTGMATAERVLEVGCGTGAILGEVRTDDELASSIHPTS